MIRTRIVAWQASEAEQLASIYAFEGHERELLNDYRRLKHQLDAVRV